jgi:hypothetical protein
MEKMPSKTVSGKNQPRNSRAPAMFLVVFIVPTEPEPQPRGERQIRRYRPFHNVPTRQNRLPFPDE